MEIFKEIEPLRAFLQEKRFARKSIGLVPTMGALHSGHLSLIRASKAENDLTVASIYVNPTQFNNPDDLEKYPRTQEEDIRLLSEAGCQILFLPPNSEMYAESQELKFDFGSMDKVLEGKFRPGHFSGVALVVSKLFNITQPDKAYFGQKDYQQFQIINHLRKELKFNVELRSVAIVREDSGLAMSSRNQRLSIDGKKKALLLYESLLYSKNEVQKGNPFNEIRAAVEKRFEQCEGVKLDYIELANRNTLQSLNTIPDLKEGIILIAAFVDDVRLIDNLLLAD